MTSKCRSRYKFLYFTSFINFLREDLLQQDPTAGIQSNPM